MTPDRSDSPRAASSKTVAEDSPSPFIELCTGVRADPDQRQTEIYQKLEAIVHSKFFPKIGDRVCEPVPAKVLSLTQIPFIHSCTLKGSLLVWSMERIQILICGVSILRCM